MRWEGFAQCRGWDGDETGQSSWSRVRSQPMMPKMKNPDEAIQALVRDFEDKYVKTTSRDEIGCLWAYFICYRPYRMVGIFKAMCTCNSKKLEYSIEPKRVNVM